MQHKTINKPAICCFCTFRVDDQQNGRRLDVREKVWHKYRPFKAQNRRSAVKISMEQRISLSTEKASGKAYGSVEWNKQSAQTSSKAYVDVQLEKPQGTAQDNQLITPVRAR